MRHAQNHHKEKLTNNNFGKTTLEYLSSAYCRFRNLRIIKYVENKLKYKTVKKSLNRIKTLMNLLNLKYFRHYKNRFAKRQMYTSSRQENLDTKLIQYTDTRLRTIKIY